MVPRPPFSSRKEAQPETNGPNWIFLFPRARHCLRPSSGSRNEPARNSCQPNVPTTSPAFSRCVVPRLRKRAPSSRIPEVLESAESLGSTRSRTESGRQFSKRRSRDETRTARGLRRRGRMKRDVTGLAAGPRGMEGTRRKARGEEHMSFAVPRGATDFDAWDSYIKREAPGRNLAMRTGG